MSNPTLVVMAAGMGSRYGGLKQIDPVGPSGEIILDYSTYDALRAGFDKVVFVIRRDIEKTFRDVIGRKLEGRADVAYVFQQLDDLPDGFAVPEGRTKPWGTGHAVLSARDAVSTPFAVINADDFYGQTAFKSIGDYLYQAADSEGVCDYCMVGYELRNTLSENGEVARGVCDVTSDGFLVDIHERTRIQQFEDGIKYVDGEADWVALADDSTVSLNLWGFTPSIMCELSERFAKFLTDKRAADMTKVEYFLPEVVGATIKEHKSRVRVLPTGEKWYGVTYQEDRPLIQAAIRDMVRGGTYPERLWEQK
ncbi:MAG: nucleotidyltransferase [Armatimonadota bacterium]